MKHEVRSRSGTPQVSDFASASGTPIVIDLDTGIAYYLDSAGAVQPIGGGITIGTAVTGGGPDEVLYIDSSENLASDPDFTFDGTNVVAKGLITVGGNSATSSGVIIKGNAGVQSGYFVPLSSHIGAGTSLDPVIASDNSLGSIRFYTGADPRAYVHSSGTLELPTTGASAGLLVGDARWYRSAADTWRTPDSIVVDVSTTTGGISTGTAVKTGNYTVTEADTFIVADTGSSAVTITLPASPTNGQVVIVKKRNTTTANALTIARNGQLIENAASDITISTADRPCYVLQYDSSTGSWWIKATFGPSAIPGTSTVVPYFSGSGLVTNDTTMTFDGAAFTLTGRTMASSNYPLQPPYTVGSMFPGLPGASEDVLRWVFERSVTLPQNLTNSQATAQSAATGDSVFDIQRDGSSIGSLEFEAAGDSGIFTFSSDRTFTAGQTLQIVSPGTPDATLSDLSFTIAGYRS